MLISYIKKLYIPHTIVPKVFFTLRFLQGYKLFCCLLLLSISSLELSLLWNIYLMEWIYQISLVIRYFLRFNYSLLIKLLLTTPIQLFAGGFVKITRQCVGKLWVMLNLKPLLFSSISPSLRGICFCFWKKKNVWKPILSLKPIESENRGTKANSSCGCHCHQIRFDYKKKNRKIKKKNVLP